MSAEIRLDLRSAVPPYEQIRAQVAGHIAAGTMSPGDRLPTVRDLASDLGVAPGTVQRAYRELELGGLVHSRRRHGTSVADSAVAAGVGSDPGNVGDAAPASVRESATALVVAARSAGMSDGAVLDLVRGTLAAASDRKPGR